MCSRVLLFFFFQAEDGIRDYKVTGVQTCALPISFSLAMTVSNPGQVAASNVSACTLVIGGTGGATIVTTPATVPLIAQIGRASCRERVSSMVGAEPVIRRANRCEGRLEEGQVN